MRKPTTDPMYPAFTGGETELPRPRQKRRDWRDAICFSCGWLGHKATSCMEYNGTLPFLQSGWRSVKSLGGVTMILPQVHRRAENDE